MKLAAEQHMTESHKVVRMMYELQRRQRQATVWMALCIFAMTGLMIIEHHYLANIIFDAFAAFAEAAAINGFAIWFAVLELLIMLLDLPVPHANTVCRNQSWIAAKPRRILETVFCTASKVILGPGSVQLRLLEGDRMQAPAMSGRQMAKPGAIELLID